MTASAPLVASTNRSVARSVRCCIVARATTVKAKHQSTTLVNTRLDDVRSPEAAMSRCADCGDNWLDFCLQCEAEIFTESTSQTQCTVEEIDTTDSSGQPPRGRNITVVDAFASMAKVRSR